MEVSKVFSGCFKKMSHHSFKRVSRKIEGVSLEFKVGFKCVWEKVNGCLKDIQWKFQGSFKCLSRVFQGSCKGQGRNNTRIFLTPNIIGIRLIFCPFLLHSSFI